MFGPETSQEDVYETIVGPLCARFIGGESCALIAYGMTNAGKTFTIQGSTKNTGIFPRLVTAVLNKCTSLKESSLELSILEIYQEKLQDLLAQKKEKLSIRDGNGKIEVANLSSHKVNSVTDAVKYLEVAASKRYGLSNTAMWWLNCV